MSNRIVIYHAHCSDGLGAAWAFRRAMPDATFHAAMHDGSPPPDVADKEVYIVDYSYPREVLLEMKAKAKSLVLLDHHKSAMEKVGDLDFCTFDMNRSGAGMAWDYLFPNEKRHWLIDYTEDKDIWRWTCQNSREVNSALQSYPLTFEAMDELSKRQPIETTNYFDEHGEHHTASALRDEGATILRANRNMIDGIVNKAREIDIQGHKVMCVNSPVLQSEIGNYLSKNKPFAAVWFENELGEKVYSLRSSENGVDVSKIAAAYGGGGHAKAAGFRLKVGENL